MSRPRGSIIGARPTWTSTATSGIWTLRQAEEMQADGQWPRGPVAPTSLAGTGGDQQVALTWVAPATTHGTITDYVVEYTPAAGSPTVVATGSTAASYTLTGLTNDTEYTFRVAAVNHTRGDWSDSVAVTPSAVAAEGWDISTATYLQNFSVASQDTEPKGLFFKPDGLKMYVVGDANDSVFEYSLSTAWDISTAAYVTQKSVVGGPTGVFFKPDGSKMYVTGDANNWVAEYSIASAWDVSSAGSPSVKTVTSSPSGLFFKPDGLTLYVSDEGNPDRLTEYSLGTAWDISTASTVRGINIDSLDLVVTDVFFKPDGLRMYTVGAFADEVNESVLSTAWDITTASYVQNFSVAAQEGNPQGVFFRHDGLKMYVIGNNGDAINEYDLTPA